MSLTRRGLQPWGTFKLFPGVHRTGNIYLNRTVLVKDNDVEQAYRVMNQLLAREGVLDRIKRMQRFEKPHAQRTRRNYEICKAIYDEDMNRKIRFIMRKNRPDPYPGQ